MARRQPINRQQANKIRTNADIVFCVDATGSMEPCISGIRDGITTFVDGLQTAAEVDFRLRLIAYRDRHDPSCGTKWDIEEFTASAEVFKKQVAGLVATGGGDESESTLDAIYLASTSDWRPVQTHKAIILFTDADTHPTIHPTTYPRRDNGVERVIQELQTLPSVLLYLVAPQFPIYERLQASMKDAQRKIIADWVPKHDADEKYRGLAGLEWGPLMNMLGKLVSTTSVAAAEAVR